MATSCLDRAAGWRALTLTPSAIPLAGPEFSTFSPEQVQWLLTDYSHLDLERPVREREALIQSNTRHYAEDLPQEHLPEPDYLALADRILIDCASDVAAAVLSVADQIAHARPNGVVLVSLVRAGVPAGIWIREALRRRHGISAPHYAISIVKGHGLDPRALDYLTAHEEASSLMFVDGWTGKGSILRALREYLGQHRNRYASVPADLAVLADPGGFASITGTREDLLIPTAMLNSTSCGLISRTVLPHASAPVRGFHGAKYYRKFAPWDRSQHSINAVNRLLSIVAPSITPNSPSRATDIAGLAERLGSRAELMKPGVGETTRVLQRRVPDHVAIHPEHVNSVRLEHILVLAESSGVPVSIVDTGPYACVGIIEPLFR